MKNKFSFFCCLVIAGIYLFTRLHYSDSKNLTQLKVTDWDAFGYYMYLPGIVIYNDVTKLEWLDTLDAQYKLTGGELYQASKHTNGNYVFKYLGGICVLQAPFFLFAHLYAKSSAHYKADGFSPPYQYAIAFGTILYFIIALFLLRNFLTLYFTDKVTAATLLLLTLASNLIQYIAVDGGMSHGYIFPLYVIILWASYKWHQKPSVMWAAVMGYVIGLATISRPTEAVMLFIPLFWNTHTKEAANRKWKMVRDHKWHLLIVVLAGLVGILPQLIYWKMVTGSFIYDVGSKWTFLNPFFRVLFGWEKGWFIYTPVTLFFIIGLLFIKKFPFRNSVLWFCILNIYIIISWFDWRYGGSYSTRALTQSYPVFALPLAAFLSSIRKAVFKAIAVVLGSYLTAVNLFQVYQYNSGILHYNDMNRPYYGRIYLNANPTPLDMSLLDTDEILYDEATHEIVTTIHKKKATPISLASGNEMLFFDTTLSLQQKDWVRVDVAIAVEKGLWNSKLVSKIGSSERTIRLDNAISKEGELNHYSFYERIDEGHGERIQLVLKSGGALQGVIQHLKIQVLK